MHNTLGVCMGTGVFKKKKTLRKEERGEKGKEGKKMGMREDKREKL